MVAPLDWGLGHATRCIPVIRALLHAGYEVILAGEGAQANLLQTEFPSLPCLPLAGYKVRYSKNPALLPLSLLGQFPRLRRIIRQENEWLQRAITEYGIDLVISDNRYGLYTSQVPCIFITHQLLIKAPFRWLEKALQRYNYSFINRFTACWVPDAEGEISAAGLLSHPPHMPSVPVHYLGLLSRFELKSAGNLYDYCVLLSGPEPQRTILENKLLIGLAPVPGKILLVRGKPGSSEKITVPANVEIKNHLPNNELQQVLLQSDIVVSRSGYTTIMELLSLKKKAILIPTPGQTEQEYLAQKLAVNKYCIAVKQEDLDCIKHFALAKDFNYQTVDLPVCSDDRIKELVFLLQP